MLHTQDPQAIVLPNGEMTIEIEVVRPTIITLKGVGLNLAMLPTKTLHLLQDGMIAELWARE